MMDKFRAQSIRFGTKIITETISNLDLSARPFKYWREGQEKPEDVETADTVILATGASAKRMNLPGEDVYWQSGISACAVCDGAVPIFRCLGLESVATFKNAIMLMDAILILGQEPAVGRHRRR